MSVGMRLGDKEAVNFVTADDEIVAGRLVKTLAITLDTSDPADQGQQLCSYLFSIITAYIPSLVDAGLEAVRRLGGNPTLRKIPEHNEICLLELVDRAHPTYCLCVFAQAVFMLFKNLNMANYTAFMNKRISALRAITGANAMPADTDFLMMRLEKGIVISQRVGSCKSFKKELLYEIIEASKHDDEFGSVCAYIISILTWSGMSSMVLISKALLATKSPVLFDARVSGEVKNLAIAFDIINRSEYPQFYQVMHTPMECVVLDRNKFSMLLAVAAKIRANDTQSMNQFVSTRANDPLVETLYAIHLNSHRPSSNAMVINAVNYLTNFEEEEFGYAVEEDLVGRNVATQYRM